MVVVVVVPGVMKLRAAHKTAYLPTCVVVGSGREGSLIIAMMAGPWRLAFILTWDFPGLPHHDGVLDGGLFISPNNMTPPHGSLPAV